MIQYIDSPVGIIQYVENGMSWDELNKIFHDLLNVRDDIYKKGLVKTDSSVIQYNWRQLEEVQFFIDELAYARSECTFRSDIY